MEPTSRFTRLTTAWLLLLVLLGGLSAPVQAASGVTTRVSVDSAGTQANGDSFLPALSADGHFVAFVSGATNLVADDTNGALTSLSVTACGGDDVRCGGAGHDTRLGRLGTDQRGSRDLS
jgi:hypothetical protein